MWKIILPIMMWQFVVGLHGFDDVPRFFTNGHGGYQFFHAEERQNQIADRRIDTDSDSSYSDTVKYIVKAPEKKEEPPEEIEAKLDEAISAPLKAELPEISSTSTTTSTPISASTSTTTSTTTTTIRPKLTRSTTLKPVKVTINSAPSQTTQSLAVKLLNHRRLMKPKLKLSNNILSGSDKSDAQSSENQILKDHITTAKPRIPVRYTTPSSGTRKRIVVRKFKPSSPSAEKNKKREISTATGNGLHSTSVPAQHKIPHMYKFTNRNFKPRQVEKPKNNVQTPALQQMRGALFTRKPSDKFMQLHFRKIDVTTTTTAASTMKEKRHLANMRFFNRRKLRT